MRPLPLRLAALTCIALFLLASRVAFAAWGHDPANPIPLQTIPLDQTLEYRHSTLPDGAGGMFVAWAGTDYAGNSPIRVQRLNADGSVASGWPADGVLACSAAGQRNAPQLVPDGAGGVLLVWIEVRQGRPNSDIYAQHVLWSGSVAPGWPSDGLAVVVVNFDNLWISTCSDGLGGAFVGYAQRFNGLDIDVFLARVTSGRVVTSVPVDRSAATQSEIAITSDGSNGCYLAYSSNATGNADVMGARYNSALASSFGTKTLAGTPADQWSPQVVLLGTGNAEVFWVDASAGNGSQRVTTGFMTPAGAQGADPGPVLFDALTSQLNYRAVPDGLGGCLVAWLDNRSTGAGAGLYAGRLDRNGQRAPGWPSGGVFLCNGSLGLPWTYDLVADGSGGMIAAWSDAISPPSGSLLASHVDVLGHLRPLSVPGGRLVGITGGYVGTVALQSDGAGGAFAVWNDSHALVGGLPYFQVYAQHFDDYVTLGDPRPTSAGVKDIRFDQGGQVRVTWNASWLDNRLDYGIDSYWLWRQAPITAAQQAVQRGTGTWSDAGSTTAAAVAAGRRVFRASSNAAADYAWEYLGSTPAHQAAQYSMVAPTASDSVAGHNPYTAFMVEAHAAADARALWASLPDSGYSADNLAPATPAPFAGSWTPGLTTLHWDPNREADLSGYRLYRGGSANFTPGPGNLVATPAVNGWSAASAPAGWYKLTAIDVHGNESPVATLLPTGLAGVDEPEAPRALAFALASASPAAGPVRLRFALPQASPVRIAIYDAAGREVRVLADGAFGAGEWTRAWDGTDARGHLAASGLYFARLATASEERTLRFVRAR